MCVVDAPNCKRLGSFILAMLVSTTVVSFSVMFVCGAATQEMGYARIFTEAISGDVHINAPGNGKVMLSGQDPVAMSKALSLENAMLQAKLANAQYTLAGLGTKQWVRQIGTSAIDHGNGVVADSKGNVYMVGLTAGNFDGGINAGGYDYFIVKWASNSTKLWSRQVGTAEDDGANGVIVDADDNVVVVGQTSGGIHGHSNSGSSDIFVVKYNETGSVMWSQQYGTIETDFGYAVTTDYAGDIVICGSTHGGFDGNTHAGNRDILVLKLRPDTGEIIWSRQLGGVNGQTGEGVGVDAANNVYVSATTSGGDVDGQTHFGSYDWLLAKYDSNGAKQWVRIFGNTNQQVTQNSATDADGNTYLVGRNLDALDGQPSNGGHDAFLSKYDADGVRIWTVLYGGSANEVAYDVAVAPGGSGSVYVAVYSIAGTLEGPGNHAGAGGDAYLVKFDWNGDVVWSKKPREDTSLFEDRPLAVTTDSSGNIYMCGLVDGAGTLLRKTAVEAQDAFIVKFGLEG